MPIAASPASYSPGFNPTADRSFDPVIPGGSGGAGAAQMDSAALRRAGFAGRRRRSSRWRQPEPAHCPDREFLRNTHSRGQSHAGQTQSESCKYGSSFLLQHILHNFDLGPLRSCPRRSQTRTGPHPAPRRAYRTTPSPSSAPRCDAESSRSKTAGRTPHPCAFPQRLHLLRRQHPRHGCIGLPLHIHIRHPRHRHRNGFAARQQPALHKLHLLRLRPADTRAQR
jgi:hypothetical protein